LNNKGQIDFFYLLEGFIGGMEERGVLGRDLTGWGVLEEERQW
jgi:hypothetical protein